MPTVMANGIDVHYETFGEPEDPALLLVMGLGAQMIAWDDDFCLGLVDRGFHVIRYDNRDAGLSTHFSDAQVDVLAALTAAASGQPVDAPYRLSDMARDGIALLDELGIERAHIVGASMGGMIVQTMAIEHPRRVQSMTSIMSTTGEREVGQPTGEAMQALLAPPAQNRDEAIQRAVATQRVIGSPDHVDEQRVRDRAARAFDRAFDPPGIARQLVAINASGSRADGLRKLDVPTLVIHGTVDPLVTPSGGQRTAELVPGAELLMIDGMGHDLPPVFWPQIIEAITSLAARAGANA